METNLKKAIENLRENDYTFYAFGEEMKFASYDRGVQPLVALLDMHRTLKGFSVADKVIGKAAAFLYVMLAPDEIYTDVISKPALEVFEKYGISVEYGTLTEAIRNRTDTGFCPMETAVKDAENPEEALTLIRQKLEQLNKS